MSELSYMVENVMPGILKFIYRRSKLTGKFFCYRSSPYVRQGAIRLIGDIFKYYMCPGFESWDNNVSIEDNAGSGENVKTDSESFEKMVSYYHKNDVHLTRKVNRIK